MVIDEVADEFPPLAVGATLELLAVEESLDLIEVTHVQSGGLPHLHRLRGVELRHARTHWRELTWLAVHWLPVHGRHPHWLAGEGGLHHGRRKHVTGRHAGGLHWSHLTRHCLHLNGGRRLLLLGLSFLLVLVLASSLIASSALVLSSVLIVVVPTALIVLAAIEQLQDVQSSYHLLAGNTAHLRRKGVQQLSLLYVLIGSLVLTLLQVGLSLFLGFAVADIHPPALELFVWGLFLGGFGSISFSEAHEGLASAWDHLHALDLSVLREVAPQVLLR